MRRRKGPKYSGPAEPLERIKEDYQKTFLSLQDKLGKDLRFAKTDKEKKEIAKNYENKLEFLNWAYEEILIGAESEHTEDSNRFFSEEDILIDAGAEYVIPYENKSSSKQSLDQIEMKKSSEIKYEKDIQHWVNWNSEMPFYEDAFLSKDSYSIHKFYKRNSSR